MNNEEIPEITVPLDIKYYSYGADNEFMSSLPVIFNPNFGQLSRYIDVSNLEGITFSLAEHYEEAINCVDRGFDINSRIIPSIDGAGMTLAIKRENVIKCHIVFNISKWNSRKNENNEKILANDTLSLIAHEMTHVEIMNSLHRYKKDICFPKLFNSLRQGKGFEISKLSVEEFGACKRSYFIDDEKIAFHNFELVLIQYLNQIKLNQILFINEFKEELQNQVTYNDACWNYTKKSYDSYGRLFILCSYYLGSKDNHIECHIEIKNNPLFKYIEDLLIYLNEAYKNYPEWENMSFENIEILLEQLIMNEADINFKINIWGIEYFTVNF